MKSGEHDHHTTGQGITLEPSGRGRGSELGLRIPVTAARSKTQGRCCFDLRLEPVQPDGGDIFQQLDLEGAEHDGKLSLIDIARHRRRIRERRDVLH